MGIEEATGGGKRRVAGAATAHLNRKLTEEGSHRVGQLAFGLALVGFYLFMVYGLATAVPLASFGSVTRDDPLVVAGRHTMLAATVLLLAVGFIIALRGSWPRGGVVAAPGIVVTALAYRFEPTDTWIWLVSLTLALAALVAAFPTRRA